MFKRAGIVRLGDLAEFYPSTIKAFFKVDIRILKIPGIILLDNRDNLHSQLEPRSDAHESTEDRCSWLGLIEWLI